MTDTTAPPAPRSRSLTAALGAGLVALCAIVPYSLVALGLRLLMARVFFLSGQGKVDGLNVRINLYGFDFTVILPQQIKDATLQAFAGQYAALPIPTNVTAYLFTYAEFLLPVCLVIGFATRLSALMLLLMSVLMVIYATPQTLWTMQAYWIAILLVLMSVGPGAISLDALIRYLNRRDTAPAFH